MKRWIGRLFRVLITLLVLLVGGLVGVVGSVEASDGMRGDKCVVEKNQRIREDFYFLCRTLDVYGKIDGDLIGIAMEVTLWPGSSVTGDVWVAGGKLDIAGAVDDDLHFGGVVANVRSEARFDEPETDLAAVALVTSIDEGAELSGGILFFGYQMDIKGNVSGNVDFTGEALMITGNVEGSIDASVGDVRRSTDLPALPFWDVSFHNPGLWIEGNGQVGGDLHYRSESDSLVPADRVEGDLVFTLTQTQLDITKAGQPNEAAQIMIDYFRRTISDIITLMIIGVIVLRVMPQAIRQPATHVRRRVISAVGWGLVTFMFSVPAGIMVVLLGLILVAILYFVKLIGLMVLVTVALLVAGTGLLGGFYFLLFFMGRIVISFLFGQLLHRYVLHLPEWGQMRQWVFTLAIGSAVYTLITNIPVPAIGLIFELVTGLAGGGAVIITLRDFVAESGLFMARVEDTQDMYIEPVALLPAPRLEPKSARQPVSPGLTNLPEGFTGFDEDW